MIAEQKRRYYSLKAVIAALGHSFPEAKRLFLDVAKRDGQFDPVRVLSRMQCLFILRYPWVSLDDYGSAGSIGTRLIEGKALDMVAKAKNKAEASVLRAAAVTQDAVLEIHSQDAVLLAHPDAPTAASPTLSPPLKSLMKIARRLTHLHCPPQFLLPSLGFSSQLSMNKCHHKACVSPGFNPRHNLCPRRQMLH